MCDIFEIRNLDYNFRSQTDFIRTRVDEFISEFMLTTFIQPYCVNLVVNIKPVYSNKHVFPHVPLQL